MHLERWVEVYVWFVALFSVGVGLILLIIAYYVRTKTVAATQLVEQLLERAEAYEGDPLTFFKKTEALLKKVGAVCVYMEIVWFGKPVKLGTPCPLKIDERYCNSWVLGGDEIEAKVLICRKSALRGDALVVYQAVEKLWRQLLSSQINGRITQVHFSQQNVQRYALFYKHDLKNLAQFMELCFQASLHAVMTLNAVFSCLINSSKYYPTCS